MRWRMLCVSVSAPSAVCTTEMPSWVLRTATFRPPICERRPSEMARPAASSAARLMRKPEESFSSDLLIWPSVTDRLRYALSAAMLLLTRRPTMFLLGRAFLPRYVRAAEALLGAGGVYGAQHGELEAKSETVVTGGTEVMDHGHGRRLTCRFPVTGQRARGRPAGPFERPARVGDRRPRRATWSLGDRIGAQELHSAADDEVRGLNPCRARSGSARRAPA